MSLADDLKKQTDDFRTKKIDYQVDTLGVDNKSSSLGYYISGANTITTNYHENDEWLRYLEESSLDAIIYHEQKHRSNNNKGFRSESISVSLKQYHKLCMADEISANMAELVYLREEYIKTRDINVFDKDGEKFSFYKEAVQKGEVNPFSSDPKDFEKDMSLIMNGTQKMWEDVFTCIYDDNHISKTKWYLRYGKGDFKDNEAEYQKQLDIAYTIGGVNFKQYMQKDVQLSGRALSNCAELERLRPINDFSFKDNMSFEQYNNLLQHLYVATSIKAFMDRFSKLCASLGPDWVAANIRDEAIWAMSNLKEKELVKEFVNMNLNKALGEYGERLLLPDENEENYQAALKQIYNIKGIDCYSLLKSELPEKMPIENTEKVKKFEEKSLLIRCMEKIGRWEYQIIDKVANLFKKKEPKAPEQKEPKDYLKNYPKWSKDKRVSEIQYKEILDLDKPVITGILEAQRPQSASPKNTSAEVPASSAQSVTVEKNNKDKAAYLRSLSGRTPQSPRARISPLFSQMRDNKNSMELMLLRRQMGR